MPKPKLFLKESSKKSSKKSANHDAQAPQTADDYLAGVELEEGGEKWRAGDAAKSTRFFLRAIDLYDEALRKFPDSFDLAYNKARLQYELTQQPRLASQLPGTLLDLLKVSLESSRTALNLRQDNADILFNTAQVLRSLVEEIMDHSSAVPGEDWLQLLREAAELFQRCLTLQEYHYAESQAQEASEPGIASSSFIQPLDVADSLSRVTLEESWAMIVEPVTNDMLLDTVLAQLETLTSLCNFTIADKGEGRGFAWIEEYFTGLNQKLSVYVTGTDREAEAALKRANFRAALAAANFRAQRFDVTTFERALEEAFKSLDLSHDPEALCDKAQALIAFSSLLGQGIDTENTPPTISRWRALTSALDYLTAASKLASPENTAEIHLRRGDTELLRLQLGQPPILYDVAQRNKAMLLKNAATYYRGAENQAIASNQVEEIKEAVVKAALVGSLAGSGNRLRELMELEDSQPVMEDAIDDGLVTIHWLVHEGILNK